jgi:NAD-dependent deacetylase
MNNSIEQARAWLRAARHVAVLTGAGISAESGLPTFRGANGLWRNYAPQQLATPQAFARDPRLVWEWYDWRRSVHAQCRPHAGHRALVDLEGRAPQFTLITQIVDKLHEEAGSGNVLHLHGSLWRVRCLRCEREEANTQVPLAPLPPLCGCGGMLRPAVVWFGEPLPQYELRKAGEAMEQADVVLVVGTSSMVYPAAALPRMALGHGAKVIEVNPEATELTGSATLALPGAAGEILPQVVG